MVPSERNRFRKSESVVTKFESLLLIKKICVLLQALLYLIYLLDPLVKGDYVIAYFHTLTSANNYPSLAWLKEVYSILPYK